MAFTSDEFSLLMDLGNFKQGVKGKRRTPILPHQPVRSINLHAR